MFRTKQAGVHVCVHSCLFTHRPASLVTVKPRSELDWWSCFLKISLQHLQSHHQDNSAETNTRFLKMESEAQWFIKRKRWRSYSRHQVLAGWLWGILLKRCVCVTQKCRLGSLHITHTRHSFMFSSHTSYMNRSLPDHQNHSLKCFFLATATSQLSFSRKFCLGSEISLYLCRNLKRGRTMF